MPDNDNQVQQPEKLDLRSMNMATSRQEELLRVFPEIRTEGGKLDFDRLKLALGQTVDVGRERYGMTWPGKADCYKTIQNPSMGTLRPCLDESVNWDTTENMIIEGDNLEVLKLLQKSYLGSIKMIYIDPPYNTGNDFIYPDNYAESLETYLEYTGEADSEGRRYGSPNTSDSGRFHTNWLTMMYPRLYLARNLLRDDGAIFISIDDNEVANLRKLCDEIFGEENFIATVIWQKMFSPKNTAAYFSEDHDYILVYAKHKDLWEPGLLPRSDEIKARYTNPDKDHRGPWLSGALQARNYYSKGEYEVTSPTGKTYRNPKGTYWRFSRERFDELNRDKRIWWGESGDNVPRLKRFLTEVKDGVVPQTLWGYELVGHTQEAKEELLKFVTFENSENVLNSVKPTRLLRHALKIATRPSENDIVLDFFAGSGSTAHAVLAQNAEDGGNRKVILVQLPEPLPSPEKGVKTLADLTKSRVRNVAKHLNAEDVGKLPSGAASPQDRGFRVFTLQQSNFKPWDAGGDSVAAALERQMELHIEHIREDRSDSDLLFELLLKSGFPLTTPVDTLVLSGKRVFSVATGALMLCLERPLTMEVIRAIADKKPERVVCLDAGFAGNDQLKTNAVQIFKTKGIGSFKTV